MRLDFNETNILIYVVNDLEKYKKPINKTTIIGFLHELLLHTDKNYIFIQKSAKSLASKIERLSDSSISQIHTDVKSNNVVATLCYILPEK